MIGYEGTPWVSIEIERATPRDRPYGWIVAVRTPGRLELRPAMRWTDAAVIAAGMLEQAIRREVPSSAARDEPLPPSRRQAV